MRTDPSQAASLHGGLQMNASPLAQTFLALGFLMAAGCSRQFPLLDSMPGLARFSRLIGRSSRSDSSNHLGIVAHETPSGVKILIQQTPGVGVVTLDAWVATGSADEPPSLGGVSHFLEHMLFKGTRNFAPGEMDRLVEGMGGELNAATAQDFTHYYITAPSENIAKALAALADAVMESTLDPAELEKERGVVLEEINRKDDDPMGLLYETAYETAFLSGPYRGSVLGQADVIAHVSREDMLEYYRRRYTPKTVILVAVGDLTAEDVMSEADRVFAAFNRPLQSFENAGGQTRWNAGADLAIEKDVNEAYVALVYPGPSLREPRFVVATDVLQTALATGRASRLYRELKERRQIVTTISAGYPTHRYDSFFLVAATAAPERLEEFRAALEEQLARVCREKFSAEELRRAKRSLINEHYFSKETSSGAASVLGYYFTLTGALDFEANYIKTIESISAGEVCKAARRIFSPANAVRVVIEPKKAESAAQGPAGNPQEPPVEDSKPGD